MKRGNRIICMTISLIALSFLSSSVSYSAKEAGPVIHIDEIAHTFPTVFEGENLSHTFTLYNQGTEDLHIRSVRHS
ncbi:MAG: hypothetical protein JRL30_25730 [Deltaproteobacteria bacterium]|nr:hypothetical protein [Deltaproteobacteria bacterium]